MDHSEEKKIITGRNERKNPKSMSHVQVDRYIYIHIYIDRIDIQTDRQLYRQRQIDRQSVVRSRAGTSVEISPEVLGVFERCLRADTESTAYLSIYLIINPSLYLSIFLPFHPSIYIYLFKEFPSVHDGDTFFLNFNNIVFFRF